MSVRGRCGEKRLLIHRRLRAEQTVRPDPGRQSPRKDHESSVILIRASRCKDSVTLPVTSRICHPWPISIFVCDGVLLVLPALKVIDFADAVTGPFQCHCLPWVFGTSTDHHHPANNTSVLSLSASSHLATSRTSSGAKTL